MDGRKKLMRICEVRDVCVPCYPAVRKIPCVTTAILALCVPPLSQGSVSACFLLAIDSYDCARSYVFSGLHQGPVASSQLFLQSKASSIWITFCRLSVHSCQTGLPTRSVPSRGKGTMPRSAKKAAASLPSTKACSMTSSTRCSSA